MTCAALSPDGATYVTGSGDGKVRLWDANSGTLIRTFAGRGHSLTAIAYSPDGSKVLAGNVDGAARLWNVSTGDALRIFSGHTGSITSVAFSPDGSKVLTGSMDSTARLWNAATGNTLRTFWGSSQEGHGPIYCQAYSPDGSKVLIGAPFLRPQCFGMHLPGILFGVFLLQIFIFIRLRFLQMAQRFSPDLKQALMMIEKLGCGMRLPEILS